jgi:cephalosporin hydroxylase
MITIDGIKTYSNQAALDMLTVLAAGRPIGQALVEIGVYRGGSLQTMAKVARGPVYGVDTWGLEGAYQGGNESPDKYGIDNMAHAEKAVKGLRVKLIRAFSEDAGANYNGPPIGLLYIDGEHTQGAVIADMKAWTPHLADNAVICFDDYDEHHPDVQQAVTALQRQEYIDAPSVHGERLAVCEFRVRDAAST